MQINILQMIIPVVVNLSWAAETTYQKSVDDTKSQETQVASPNYFCSCGKGVSGKTEAGVRLACAKTYPKLKSPQDFTCSEVPVNSHICFVINLLEDELNLMVQNAPNREVALKTGQYGLELENARLLTCVDGPLKPTKHIPMLSRLFSSIKKSCQREIAALCLKQQKETQVISCLVRHKAKFKQTQCYKTLYLQN